jgi:predicted aldo/keto reductase-like oxidoreductase
VLGFGAGRLPRTDKKHTGRNEDEAAGILRFAIDRGVNYLDLPYLYDTGQRQNLNRTIGGALRDGYRQKIKIASSLPAARIKSGQDLEHYINELLGQLALDRLDFFLLGGLNRLNWPELPVEEVLRRAEALQRDGRIDHLGFSFHDDFQTLRTIIEAYDKWSLCQFQYSFMDVDHHPGVGGLKYAYDKGLAVVAGEPLKGGRLTSNLPEPIARLWAGAPEYSPAGWGLRWVWNHPEVATAVCDMSTLEQVKENLALADTASANIFTVAEELLINRVRDNYRSSRLLACTACRGCMPCPLGIDAPRIFELYNDAVMYGDVEIPRAIYRHEGHCTEICNECGLCARACGFQFPIPEWLKKAHQLLAGE